MSREYGQFFLELRVKKRRNNQLNTNGHLEQRFKL